jgi:hypothetical protein
MTFSTGGKIVKRHSKLFLVTFLISTLIGLAGNHSLLIASTSPSHSTHFDSAKGPSLPLNGNGCYVCHANGDEQCIGQLCDPCHSPEGAFPGGDPLTSLLNLDIGAKANWAGGIYESDGMTLKSDKEEWCATCHDDQPANSEHDGTGIYAPSVAGGHDDVLDKDYGYYATGHGVHGFVECLHCHDAGRLHIDGEHRTYEVVDDNTLNQAVVTPYVVGYRLEDGAMNIPNPLWTDGEPRLETEDYVLCFSCHNPEEVWGTVYWDVTHTNFWDTKNNKGNQHNYHLRITNLRSDTDCDGVQDSREGCPACHNVHGSPAGPMIRHGELISTPGTTDRVPALDFIYLGAPPAQPAATATFTATSLVGGDGYNVYAWWVDQHPVWRATDATYTISYSGGSDEVIVDQTWDGLGGGQWNLLGTYHYDPGATGTVVLDNDFSSVGFFVIADAVRWEKVGGGDEVIVDNTAATLNEDHNLWQTAEGIDQTYGGDFRYIRSHSTPVADESTTSGNSHGGWMRHRGSTIAANYVCVTCHSDDYVARYERTPKFWPRVYTFPGASADILPNDGTGQLVITVLVADPDDNLSTVTIDLSPVGGSDVHPMTELTDETWQYTWNVAQGTLVDIYDLVITATDTEGNTGTGKVTIEIFEPGAIYVDDIDAVVVPDCVEPCDDPAVEWVHYSNAQQYGTGFRYKLNDAAGNGTMTWTSDLPEAGQYKVYAWWSAESGHWRSENVPYTVYYDGGYERVEVNQTTGGPGGGQWNYLGTWTFAAGTSGSVVLSDDATDAPLPGGATVVAGDAIKWVPAQ